MARVPITLRRMNSFAGKRLLAPVSERDYANAGDEAAIELAFGAVPKRPGPSKVQCQSTPGKRANFVAAGAAAALEGKRNS